MLAFSCICEKPCSIFRFVAKFQARVQLPVTRYPLPVTRYPLPSLEVVVNLIGHTTTRSGLAIRSELDANNYPTGQPVTAQQMESISLKRDAFHGDWNYSLAPR